MKSKDLNTQYVIGADFGTDSIRAILIDAIQGKEIRQATKEYTRWKKGLFCQPEIFQYRQHPLDYIEALKFCVIELLDGLPELIVENVKGISIAATGSTVAAVDETGMPLALQPKFEDDPHAMFILWKDHTAFREAEEINTLAESWDTNYTKYSGGMYSSEWFWSKILYTLRNSPEVKRNAVSWVELSDWIPALLTGCNHHSLIKRNRCSAGHKAMWHSEFKGLPSEEFLVSLDGKLKGVRANFYTETLTSDKPAGFLSETWAKIWGLPPHVTVGVGGIDAHFGAVGANIKENTLVKVIGTSTCDMAVLPMSQGKERLIPGICGQVRGSIFPDMIGLEAGQSAFGDLFDWFVNLLLYGYQIQDATSSENELKKKIFEKLTLDAQKLKVSEDDLVILDWINGRRTPDVNFLLNTWITGVNLATDVPKIFKGMVESVAYGSRKIMEELEKNQVPIHEIIATGGISKKSPFVMQTLANVLNRPIRVIRSEQSGALGACIFASVACGIHAHISVAQQIISSGIEREYIPDKKTTETYNKLYKKYIFIGEFQESKFFSEKPNR